MPDPQPTSFRERLIQRIGGYSSFMFWYRSVRPKWLWRRTSPFGRPTSRYVSENGAAIRRGAFAGLVFPESALGHTNHMAAKLIGTYEPGVIAFLGEQVGSTDVFVDLGSGDGFFCTGMARLGPVRSIGYEVNRYERKVAQQIAAVNNVEVETRGLADETELNALPDGRLLILCDIEGYEEELLDPQLVPRLREATMVVEAHDQFRPDVITVLTERFRETHEIERIFARPADPSEFDELKGWDEKSAELVVFDGHASPDESWLIFVPK